MGSWVNTNYYQNWLDAKPTFNEGGKAATNCGGGIFYGFESISGMEASKKNQVLGESMKQKL